MGKQLVLCFDGTWNRPSQPAQGRTAQTNVCHVFQALNLPDCKAAGIEQSCKFYDMGVGAEGSLTTRVVEGLTGLGVSRNMLDGYAFLMERWRAGDDVYILGFSRGAYSARSLVGMIRNVGLLPAGQNKRIDEAYKIYRHRQKDPESVEARKFKAVNQAPEIPIKFLGVWDTVGALGIPPLVLNPFRRNAYEFHDTRLSSIVANAYHAVAIDEHRPDYEAALWTGTPDPGQTVEQVWFRGAHADVGGGYSSRALSDHALGWMMDRATTHGLSFNPVTLAPAVIPATDSYAAFCWGLYKKIRPRAYRPIWLATDQLHHSVRQHVSAGYSPRNEGFDRALRRPFATP